MARISLLFSLALVLAIGSVLAHPPTHKKTQKTLCPPTLSKLQSFPYSEVSKFVQKQAQSAQNNIQFKMLFATCKGYTDFLGGFAFSGSKEAMFHSVHAKFSLMTRTLLAAQAQIGVEGELGADLSKSYVVMAERYVRLMESIATISTKYKYNANAKVSLSERAEIEKGVIKLKNAIRVYLRVVTKCSKKFSVVKNIGGGFVGAFAKNGLGYADKLIGFGAKVGAKAGVHAGAKAKVGGHAKAKVGGHAKGKVGAQGEAQVGGKIGGLFGGFFGFGGKAQFDAAGKANVGGGSGFRSLSNSHRKHLDD